jgi:hypothetical protein
MERGGGVKNGTKSGHEEEQLWLREERRGREKMTERASCARKKR